MTVEKLRKAAEDYIEARDVYLRKSKTSLAEVEWEKYKQERFAFRQTATPERVLALCELARVMDDTHLIARQSPDWPGERFLNGTDEGTLALEALAAIEAAFGESDD